MITKKKSSLLKTHKTKRKENYKNVTKNENHSNSSINNVSDNSKTIQRKIKKYSDYYNNNMDYDSKYSIISIDSNFTPSPTKKKRKKYKTFLSKVHTLRRMKRKLPLGEDNLSKYLDDHRKDLKDGKMIKINNLNKLFFNHTLDNCICEAIYDKKPSINTKCKCNTMAIFNFQGRSGASIYSLTCSNKKNIVKILPLNENYMKMINKTNKYIYIETNRMTLATLIHTYINNELPNNSINMLNSGICIKQDYKDHSKIDTKNINKNHVTGTKYGYNLISYADLGNGTVFIKKLLNGDYDKEFGIINETIRYEAVVNFLLQTILLIGHLHSSKLEFFHGDYKPDNLLIKRCRKSSIKYYKFKVYGHTISVKNMGFSVLISDFDFSSITINSEISNKKHNISNNDLINNDNDNDNDHLHQSKYRLVPPIVSPLLLSKYVNTLIQKFADIDTAFENLERKYNNHDIYDNDYNKDDKVDNNDDNAINIKINKVFISHLAPLNKDPIIHIMRSAGIKLYRDFDIYLFMVKLLDDIKIRDYIVSKKLDQTILGFMSVKFKKHMLNRFSKTKSISETAYVIVDIFEKINEPMYKIFTKDYFNILKNLNYKLFKI